MSSLPVEYREVAKRMEGVGLERATVEKEVSFACQIIAKSSQLKNASVQSKQAAVLNIAQTGLTLNPVMKLAYLVPRWDNATKSMACCLEPSYQGLVKLLTDTGSIEAVTAQLVYENDQVEVTSSDFNNPITHKPNPFGDRGKVIGAYALAILPSGVKQLETMSIDELHEIRDRSESYKAFKLGKIKSCVWTTDEGEMMRKTVVRRIVKYLPKSEKFEKAATAIQLDEQDYKPSEGQKMYVAELLSTSTIDDRLQWENYEHEIYNCNTTRLKEIEKELREVQRPNSRRSMTEINEEVSKRIAREE